LTGKKIKRLLTPKQAGDEGEDAERVDLKDRPTRTGDRADPPTSSAGEAGAEDAGRRQRAAKLAGKKIKRLLTDKEEVAERDAETADLKDRPGRRRPSKQGKDGRDRPSRSPVRKPSDNDSRSSDSFTNDEPTAADAADEAGRRRRAAKLSGKKMKRLLTPTPTDTDAQGDSAYELKDRPARRTGS